MEENFKDAFIRAKYKPDVNQSNNILHRIAKHEKRVIHLRFYTFSIIGIISLICLIPAFKMLLSDFAKSGFYEYLSIIFSSNGSLVYFWKDLSYSLAESLPITSLIYSSTLIFIFFISLRYALKQIIKGQLSLSF